MYIKVIKTMFRTRKFKNIGLNCIVERGNFYHPESIDVSNSVYIGPGAEISANGGLKILEGTIIGPKVTIYTSNHNFNSNDITTIPYDNLTINKEVTVESNVWIGGNVILLPGTHVGRGSIIGAGEVVRGKVPPFSIYINGQYSLKRKNIDQFLKLESESRIYMKEKMDKYEKVYKIFKKLFRYFR